MQRLLIVLAFVSLVPASALAQETAGSALSSPTYLSPAPAPVTAPATAPTGVDPELIAVRAEGASSPDRAAARSWTVVDTPYEEAPQLSGPNFGESLGHAWAGFGIGAGGGGAVGALMGCAVTAIFGGCPFGAMFGAPVGAIALAPLGAALGAWGWGQLAGGTGNFFAAFGLSLLGAGVGVGSTWLVSDTTQSAWGALVGPLVGAVFSTLGAAAGYQLSSHGPARRPVAARSPELLVVPTIAPSQHNDGATVGVAGMF